MKFYPTGNFDFFHTMLNARVIAPVLLQIQQATLLLSVYFRKQKPDEKSPGLKMESTIYNLFYALTF